MIQVTGAEPVPEDSEEHAPPAKEEGESEPRGFCAEEWGSVPGETSEELSDSEYGTPAPDELPYDPYALEFEGRFGRIVEDPPRASTLAAASAPPQEGTDQGDCAVAASKESASEELDDEGEECGNVPAELCARCGNVVCVRCGWRGKHVTEAVRDILSEGPLPVLSELERSRTVGLCLAAAAQQTLEDDRAGDKVMTGDAITFEVMSRHHYHTQRHVTTGHAPSPVPEQPAELSVEQKEEIQKRNAELRQGVGKNEVRIQQLEE